MSFKEKFTKKQKASDEVNFGNEVSKKLLVSNLISELFTLAACIAIAWDGLRLAKLPSIIAIGVIICIFLHETLLVMVNVLVTQSITEDLATFYYYDTTEKERTKLMKQLMGMPARIGAVVFSMFIGSGIIWIIAFAKIERLNLNSIVLVLIIPINRIGFFSSKWKKRDSSIAIYAASFSICILLSYASFI